MVPPPEGEMLPPLPSLSSLPVTFFFLTQGNNQTHGHGSHRSRVSPSHPSPCCSPSYFRPVLFVPLCVFQPKNGRISLRANNISRLCDSWSLHSENKYMKQEEPLASQVTRSSECDDETSTSVSGLRRRGDAVLLLYRASIVDFR